MSAVDPICYIFQALATRSVITSAGWKCVVVNGLFMSTSLKQKLLAFSM